MRNIKFVFGMVLCLLVIWLVIDANVIGFVLGITKGIESLNIEVGLTKAVWAYVYFAVIWIVPFMIESIIVQMLIKNNTLITKKVRVLYYIFGICASLVVSYLLSFLDSVFIFFLITPVVLYGINNGIEEVIKMTFEEKEKYIQEQEKYKGGE